QGPFPVSDTGEDGYAGIAPVAHYPPAGIGIYDMAGNFWQWPRTCHAPNYYTQLGSAGKVTRNPQDPRSRYNPAEPRERKRVLRGGSFLCTDQYCSRYMVGARGKGEISTGTNHLGFRCVQDRGASAPKQQIAISIRTAMRHALRRSWEK